MGQERGHRDRRHRHVHRRGAREGRLHRARQPVHRRDGPRLHHHQGTRHLVHRTHRQGAGGRQEDRRPLPQHVRAGHHLLRHPQETRPDLRLLRAQVRQEARDRQAEQGRADGRLRVRRQAGSHALPYIRGGARRPDAQGPLPQHHGQRGHRLGPLGRIREIRPPALPRLLPHHPRHGCDGGAVKAQILGRTGLPGRRRDRGRLLRHRRLLRRRTGLHLHLRPRPLPQERSPRLGRHGGTASRRR